MKHLLLMLSLFIFVSPTLKADEINTNSVRDVPFTADYFPSSDQGKYGVIVLTGSAGGKAVDTSKRISDMGYPVLSLSYFNDGSLPDALEMIPLEYFDAPKKWLMDRKDTRNDGVILLGLSKGAELALLLATNDSDYKGVISIGSSSVVWAGIPKDTSKITKASSSWSKNGDPIDFVPYINRDGLKLAGLDSMLYWHTAALANYDAVKNAIIKVEKIHSPMLLISGGVDTAWPSSAMSVAICKRANANKAKNICKHINYAAGDHLLDNEILSVNLEISNFLNLISEDGHNS